ncbi:hypothetical protein BaRGS_00021971 [Batillaria attramentaria]|uniref:Uncharacterized protein n=1 Tax=Batillaria attramentaria TaxID=370345 RepID=A0ABD0KI27_9CAEN
MTNDVRETVIECFRVRSDPLDWPVSSPRLLEKWVRSDNEWSIQRFKVESASSPLHAAQHQDASTETCSVGVVTEPECLGPCEPGTSVTLEGIVWQETENGVLVINVTWRGKTYVGTLLDATKHDWAPPR